jgi:alpha-tubulin suppressor-like RCC1 family protein
MLMFQPGDFRAGWFAAAAFALAACNGPGKPLTGVSAVSASLDHSCALRTDGTVVCWGTDFDGEVGAGISVGASASPTVVPGLSNAVSVAVGGSHSCALLADGTVDCWGSNQSGELGGTTDAPNSPALVHSAIAINATAISANWGGTCALLSDTTVECWGDLSNAPRPVEPARVPNLTGVMAVSAGVRFACAVITGGSVQCWGADESGQLGDGTTNTSWTPVTVANLGAATTVAAGWGYACALLADGTVACWGDLQGVTLTQNTCGPVQCPLTLQPTAVPDLQGVTAIAVANNFACAVLSDRTAKCWGDNTYGQLGNGTTMPSKTPVPVSGLQSVTDISVDWPVACAVVADGSVFCWGMNADNSLGQTTKAMCQGEACATTPSAVTW